MFVLHTLLHKTAVPLLFLHVFATFHKKRNVVYTFQHVLNITQGFSLKKRKKKKKRKKRKKEEEEREQQRETKIEKMKIGKQGKQE